MLHVRDGYQDGYQAMCIHCRKQVGESFDILPPARLTVNAEGDLVMRTTAAKACAACHTSDVEIVVRPRRSA